MKIFKFALSIITAAGIMLLSCGCSVFGKITGGETLRILSGSENAELSSILDECEKRTGVNIEMTCKGSVDIMQELRNGAAGNAQLVNAMSQVLLQENAERNLLQAGTGDINVVVTFDSHVLNVYSCEKSELDE